MTVDRIVLNAYFSLGHSPGGFRVWWRRWHGDSDEQLDEQLDNAHLMRLAGRVARRVRASAQAQGHRRDKRSPLALLAIGKTRSSTRSRVLLRREVPLVSEDAPVAHGFILYGKDS